MPLFGVSYYAICDLVLPKHKRSIVPPPGPSSLIDTVTIPLCSFTCDHWWVSGHCPSRLIVGSGLWVFGKTSLSRLYANSPHRCAHARLHQSSTSPARFLRCPRRPSTCWNHLHARASRLAHPTVRSTRLYPYSSSLLAYSPSSSTLCASGTLSLTFSLC